VSPVSTPKKNVIPVGSAVALGPLKLTQKGEISQGTPILFGLEDGSSANISYCVYMVQVKFKRCTMFGERVSGYKSSLDLFLAEKGINRLESCSTVKSRTRR